MTATAPAQTESTTSDNHSTLYWIIGIVLVVLCVIGLITYGAQKSDQQAQQKAAQLTAKFRAAGLPVPVDQEIITRQLGADGGAVCHDPTNALRRAILFDQIANGGSFVGHRPVIGDTRILAGELLILQTYCPDKAKDYQDKVDDLKTDSTIND
jgi:hypothetical protein